MGTRLEDALGGDMVAVGGDARVLFGIALEENARGIRDPLEYEARLRERTACVTMLAGAGTRWTKSLAEAGSDFDPSLPRGLFPVRNFLDPSLGERVPIAAYSLAATKGLGRHVIVVRGHEERIRSSILEPLGLGADGWEFRTQEAPFGKPLGHGDAAWQTMDAWSDSEYVVVNFGGDANSRLTVLSALAALDAAKSLGMGISLVVPVARMIDPAYPIAVGEDGLPRSFGHSKLSGTAVSRGEAFTNVGVRVYDARALEAECRRFRESWWDDATGWNVPGNDPEGHEFALDNVDAELASGRLARLAWVASPDELSPVKAVGDAGRFEEAIARVASRNAPASGRNAPASGRNAPAS